MNLPPNAWYTRWFLWSAEVIFQWTRGTSAWQYASNGTNLCQFIRVTWLWAPLIVAAHIAVLGIWVMALTLYPIQSFGVASWGVTWLYIIFAVGAVVAIVFLIWLCREYLNSRSERAESAAVQQVRRAKQMNYASVLGQWIIAKKRRICPIISFKEEDAHGSF